MQAVPVLSPGATTSDVPFASRPVTAPAAAAVLAQVVEALRASAARLGVDPLDYATVISYETGGTFDPSIRGGAGRRHIGLIQFGPNEQQSYGASQGQSFEQQLPAVESYLTDRGFKPGMGRLDLYSTINAGRPGLYDASDAGNGGAPGSVADKVANQMGAHEAKAAAFLGGSFSPGSASPVGAFGLSGPVAAGTSGSITPAGGAAMQAPQAESGPDVASLLKALGGTDQTASPTAQAQAQAKAPAPMALQPHQHRGQPFDAARYLASLARPARA